MKIGELIAQLEALKAQYGDLNAVAYGGGEDATPEPMEGDGDEALIGNLRQRAAKHQEHRAQQHWAAQGTYVEDEHIDQDLYPIVLQHGHLVIERDEPYEYPNATGIINADHSLTVTRDGEIIGWHDTDTYWRAYTQ